MKIALMGGLGNQLFQLAFALWKSDLRDFEAIDIFGNARRNSAGKVDLLDLELPVQVSLRDASISPLILRALGLGLRMSAKSVPGLPTARFFSTLLSLLAFTSSDIDRGVSFPGGLGFDSQLGKGAKKSLYCGYFQTYKYASSSKVFKAMMNLRPRPMHTDNDLRIPFENTPSGICLHVRLTDYVGNNSFGSLNQDYYERAIFNTFSQVGEQSIHVYSDDISSAPFWLPSRYSSWYTFVSPAPRTVDVLEQMRQHNAYIIANSTLSWWAAFLRHNRNAPVFSPNPWFKNSGEPIDLFPTDWQQLSSSFSNNPS